jgi:uncharacterized protein with HEPN domain
MFENKSLLYICTVLEAIEKIEFYSLGFKNSRDLLEANEQMNFNAVSRLLLAIGEETKKIDEHLLNLQPHINWNAIIGLRNRMAQDYRGIDPEIVYDIVRTELKSLKKALIEMLPRFSISREDLTMVLTSTYFKHIQYIEGYLKIKD